MIDIYHGDNLPILQTFPSESFDLIYIDPPFNTGKTQSIHGNSYSDTFNSFEGFIKPRIQEAYRLLKPNGSFFFHIDYREVHYCKVLIDTIFDRKSFMNEIIWAYDYGGRSKTRWSAKHDNILWYAKNPESYTYNYDNIDRIPYLAPGLVGPEKAAKGKTPTDVWWNTIVPTQGTERVGYPTQKPLAIINRIINVHSNLGDRVLDFFAGSGTIGHSCLNLGRNCVLIDQNQQAIDIMKTRFSSYNGVTFK